MWLFPWTKVETAQPCPKISEIEIDRNIHKCYVCCLLCISQRSIHYSLNHIRYCQLRKSATLHQEALHWCPRQVYAKLGSSENLGEAVEAVHPFKSFNPCKSRCCESSRQPLHCTLVFLGHATILQLNFECRLKLRVPQIVHVIGSCDQVWSAALETYRHSRA